MIQTFLDKNAGIVSGYTNTTYNALDIPLSKELVRLMSNGLSFQEAVLYLQNSEDVISYSQSLKDYFKIEYKETGNNLVRLLYSVDPHNFHFEPISLTQPYHLLDPYPILDEVVPDNGNCELSWEIALAPFDFDWPILSPDCEEWIGQDSTPLTIHYEVYVDGSKLDESTYPNDTQKSVSCSLSPDKHDWYVVAKIMDGGTVIASYQSNEKSFTVEDDLVELEAVDLGLSVNWANMNLGANRPEEYGDHYAWGETEPYYSSLYPFIGKEGKEGGYDWSSYKWCLGGEDLLTKYCTDYSYGYNGFTDYKTVLDPEDDAAHVNLGGNWRMPTDAEWTELRTKCTWKWTSVSGVSGHEVTGPNGKRIFLPAAGLLYNTEHYDGDTYGYYWSSSLDTVSPNVAWGVCFGSEGVLRYDYIGRCDGQSVRPVYGPFSTIPVEVVSLDKTELVLDVGETTVLVATVFPANATNANVIWSSSDESVATVSSTGAVTGVAAGSAVITVTTSDGGKTATCNVTVKETPSSSVTVPEAIDLGLPSGIKWASFNLGATKPEEFGDYYAWGETEPYYVSQNPLVWKEGKDAGYDWASYSLCMGDSNTLTKYCLYPSYGFNGFVDEKTVLDPEDDAAYVNLGGNWKIPTDDEWTELREKCTWEWTSMNGVKGRKVIGLNGNSIFLPIAGYRHGTNIYDAPYCGWYWSSTLYSYPGSAYHVHFSSESVTKNHDIRHAGYSIRPVYAE
jgi:Bacterial surface proteins containing Ig-like domains